MFTTTKLVKGSIALLAISFLLSMAILGTVTNHAFANSEPPVPDSAREYCLWEYQWYCPCNPQVNCPPSYQDQQGIKRYCCLIAGQWACDPWQATARCGCGGC